MRYRDQNGDDWTDIIDFLTMHPEARRQVVRVLAEIRGRLGTGAACVQRRLPRPPVLAADGVVIRRASANTGSFAASPGLTREGGRTALPARTPIRPGWTDGKMEMDRFGGQKLRSHASRLRRAAPIEGAT
jgi:hypothetical protein